MASTLSELCKHIQACTEKLEEEINRNIDDCHKLLLANEATETKLALEKAKDYHYKEILDYLRDIIINLRKIVVHEEKIRSLNDEDISPEELKRYSYVQRQISAFSSSEQYIMKREKRRVASEISLESLQAWEQYLEKKTEEEKVVQFEEPELPRRKRMNSKRRKKKLVSSTFGDFLDGSNGARKLDSILEGDIPEDDDRLLNNDQHDSDESFSHESDGSFNTRDSESPVLNRDSSPCKDQREEASEDSDNSIFGSRRDRTKGEVGEKYSASDEAETVDSEHCLGDAGSSKPRIVDVVYKKKTN